MTSLNQGLSDDEIILLNRFLIEANAGAKHQKDICWIDGYLCAINASLKPIPLSEWLEGIKGEGFEFASFYQGKTMMMLLMRFYDHINETIRKKTYIPIYEGYEFEASPHLELAARWAKGYLLGTVIIGEELFEVKEVNVALMPIAINAGVIPDKDLEKEISRAEMVDKIPKAVLAIAEFRDMFIERFRTQND